MQKVVGSSPIIRFKEPAGNGGFFVSTGSGVETPDQVVLRRNFWILLPFGVSRSISVPEAVTARKSPAGAGLSHKRMMGLEPTTFCMASRRSSQLSYIRGLG